MRRPDAMVPRDYVEEVISSLFEDAVDPKISVVGVGGAGGKMVSALYDRDIKGVETIAVNTDPSGLSKAECDVKILLGQPSDEDRIAGARASAEDQEGSLRESLSSDIVFVVAGLGGAAGTGAAPVVARAARANGAVTIGVAILPFEIEGRTEAARQGLDEFRREADSVIVVENDSLNRFADQMSFNEAMQVISYMVVTIVQGVVDHLTKSYLTTLAEEVENAAKEIEEQNNHAIHVEVQPPETVQAAWDVGPVAFNDDGFIGLPCVFQPSSTSAIVTNEFKPGLMDEDIPSALDRLFPSSIEYGHERRWHDGNGHSHVRATFLGRAAPSRSSTAVPLWERGSR